MSTVSFVNKNGVVTITLNRNEKVSRSTAIAPRNYNHNGKNVFYPKDVKSGGTWCSVAENGTVLVLLNGGNKCHLRRPFYRKSRGLVVLDLISKSSPKDSWNEINLSDIEPFTLILYQAQKLYKLIWDGVGKRKIMLDETKNHIWSSATLQNEDIIEKKINYFFDFLEENPIYSASEIMHLHNQYKDFYCQDNLILSEEDTVKMVSITQVIVDKNRGVIRYYDVLNEKKALCTFSHN
ncbi:NRDE family protein [Flavobacterium hercynium]|uniref:Uncharacterized protein n=1 Tax=Flavobacterium hercynium TaxID=387094 RepID=A0A226H6S8_9FLAO|nr:NRDE family protein [Flavobacterium hercynium]OXA89538.1 hypothetical protein B0A66_14050 [Flavobacterium hercynium]SMP35976.1 Transport and Golgi organisation 2 [Flavobacterium hercynium]